MALCNQQISGCINARVAQTCAHVRVPAFVSGPLPCRRQRLVVVRAADSDAELEARLAKLRQAKGATPYGEGSKVEKREAKKVAKGAAPAAKPDKKEYDFSDETLYWEGGPATGDVLFNLLLSTTLVALPVTIGAFGRAAFVRYRFTDKRFSVSTNAPWMKEQSDIAYQEVLDVATVPRLLGSWGDMVVTLKDSSKIEMRSVEKFKELKEYILARRDALGGGPPKQPSIMDLDDDEAEVKAKGFGA